jgi:hypothetical protein
MTRKQAGLAVLAAVLAVIGAAGPAWASLTLTMTQQGNDVVVSGGGTANLGGLASSGYGGQGAVMSPSLADVIVGTPSGANQIDIYGNLTGPTSFGPGGGLAASSGSGDTFGILNFEPPLELVVPSGYVSGASLSATSTFANQTFASLGVTPGTYVWT